MITILGEPNPFEITVLSSIKNACAPNVEFQNIAFDVKSITDSKGRVFERVKHGRWIDRGKNACIRWKCSECGRKDIHIYNYCPDCGARMDLDESTMGQVKVDVSIKKPTKRWDTCGLSEDDILVDSGSRGERREDG